MISPSPRTVWLKYLPRPISTSRLESIITKSEEVLRPGICLFRRRVIRVVRGVKPSKPVRFLRRELKYSKFRKLIPPIEM